MIASAIIRMSHQEIICVIHSVLLFCLRRCCSVDFILYLPDQFHIFLFKVIKDLICMKLIRWHGSSYQD